MIQSLVLALAPLLSPVSPAPAIQDPGPDINAVNDAIDKGVEFLVRMQQPDGSFGSSRAYFPGDTSAGETALVLAALLHSGLKWEHQTIRRGVEYVRQTQPQKYYGATTRLLMEEILLTNQDRKAMETSAEFLADGSASGYWDYPGDVPDLSNTQYAILGLWLARQAEIKIPDKIFEKCMKVVIRHQLEDGGWAYFGPIDSQPGQMDNTPRYSTGSMTTAAMATVLFCFDALSEKKSNVKKYEDEVNECMEKAYAWLDAHMSYTENVSLENGTKANGGWFLDVDLRIAPGPGCYAFVAQFGKDLRDKYGDKNEFGLRVESLKYFVDGVVYQEFKGDVTKNSGAERYNVALELEPGPRTVEVEVTLAPAPETRTGEVSEVRHKVRSARFQFDVDWTMTPSQEVAMEEVGQSLAQSNPPEISVSSEKPFNNPNAAKGGVSLYIGDRAVDGSMAYGWVGDEKDTNPWIRMTWGKGIKVQTIVLTPARLLPERSPFRYTSGELSAPSKVMVKINGKETEHEIENGPRQRIELPKVKSIKTLEIRIVETHPTDGKFIGSGFAEIELLGKPKKKRK